MSTTAADQNATPAGLEARVLGRLLDEGYGPGSWHGPDLKAALADIGPDTAFLRPAPGRHNIAEIALHHAYFVRAVRGQLTGAEPERFVLAGQDWFDLADGRTLSWERIRATVESEQAALARVVDGIARGRVRSPLGEVERFDLVLGIASHAIYHAGQIQLVKRLIGG